MKYATFALIAALLVAGCVGQGTGTGITETKTTGAAADESTVGSELQDIDSAMSDLDSPDVDLDATFG